MPIETKHEHFMNTLSMEKNLWSFEDLNVIVPPIGSNLVTAVNLKRHLSKGMRGSLNYQLRHEAEDRGVYDDYIEIEFNPNRVDYSSLVHEAFDVFVRAIRAHLAYIEDERFVEVDWDSFRKHNSRWSVHRVYPVSFYDRVLCERAFRSSPEAVVEKLRNQVEAATLLEDGVKIIVSSKVLPFDESNDLTRHVTELLGPPK